jgi:hypothetical protein
MNDFFLGRAEVGFVGVVRFEFSTLFSFILSMLLVVWLVGENAKSFCFYLFKYLFNSYGLRLAGR